MYKENMKKQNEEEENEEEEKKQKEEEEKEEFDKMKNSRDAYAQEYTISTFESKIAKGKELY